MPTRSALTLVDAIAVESSRHVTTLPEQTATQAAFVRALVDEVEQCHPEDEGIVPLRKQLGDEVVRLVELHRAAGSYPISDIVDARPIDALVVDDDETALRAAEAALTALGFPCRMANGAEEALDEFERSAAAIVLSDWSMPGMSGLELCIALKRRAPQTYVILATAFQDHARLLDGVRGGVDDFLHKPLDLDELEARLASAVSLIRALRTLATLHQHLSSAPQSREK